MSCTYEWCGELAIPCPNCSQLPDEPVKLPDEPPIWETEFYRRSPQLSLAAIDVGFDLRQHDIILPEGTHLAVALDGPLPACRALRVCWTRTRPGDRVELFGRRDAIAAIVRRWLHQESA